ncbi:MAG: glucose-6-phosphate isomerase [Candidatus Micrarchaeota archaeon]|nr:glucose-6-phosphate isomerase [Candidatus Micrarchaeota archaeon]
MKLVFDGLDLVFGSKKVAPKLRSFGSMRSVLAHPEIECALEPESPTYYMYREAARFGNIRYDVTRILSLDLCGEFNKTFGHTHPKTKKGTGWPEVYEVISGEANFLLQKVGQLGVDDAVLLTAKKGDALLIPPGYGHVTINHGKTDLLMGNLVSDSFEADYSMFAQRRGGCYYETHAGGLSRNPNYGTDFSLREETARKFSERFGCYAPFEKKDLLTVAKNMRDIEFLDKPELFY